MTRGRDQSMRSMKFRMPALLLIALLSHPFSVPHAARAEEDGDFILADQFGLGEPAAGAGQEVTISARFVASSDKKQGRLEITAKMAPHWHVYSLTQPPGGPTRTTISVDEHPDVKLAGEFKPDQPPKIRKRPYVEVPSEEHDGSVTWTVPVTFVDGVNVESLTIAGRVEGQVCDESCLPFELPFEAKFAGVDPRLTPKGTASPPAPSLRQSSPQKEEVAISARYRISTDKRSGRLDIKATMAPPWHIYSITQLPNGPTRTTIEITKNPEFSLTDRFKSNKPPKIKKLPFYDVPVEEHEVEVTWSAPIAFAEGVNAETATIAGKVSGQVCDQSCIPFEIPFTAEFGGTDPELAPVVAGDKGAQPPSTTSQGDGDATGPVATAVRAPSVFLWKDLLRNMSVGLLAGLILNFMPCVLPVVGLKVLSFVEQGGHNRARVLLLNLVYSAGIIAVFLVLATLAATANLSWGQHFQSTIFKVSMIGLVFVMALSFLGVWEIPIPGFVGSGTSARLATKGGLLGAFYKGIFTTILATPCSGPLLGPVLGYTLEKPPIVTYGIFFSVGLGMSLPYLLIGARTELIRFLPKPGAWMDTFKQLMGFLLLASVVFLFSTIKPSYFIPALTMVVGLWFACWWIGRVPFAAESGAKLNAWLGGTATAALITAFAFNFLVPKDPIVNWQPFSLAALERATADGKTVLVEFTAQWCPNCKWNMAVAIDTKKVAALVDQNDVVALLADWTDPSDEIKQTINGLGARTIPLLAIYPAGKIDQPIVLPDILTEKQVLSALTQAGPSQQSVAAR